MIKRTVKNDILLALSLLLLAGGFWAVLRFTSRPGAEAVVTVDGKVTAILPLDEDTVFPVTLSGGGYNTVVVENGQVCVQNADCPDRICVKQGSIRLVGESIVCLPHRLTVTVRGNADDSLDAVAGG